MNINSLLAPVRPDHMYFDRNGCLRRKYPKRDKSVSARQARKRRKFANRWIKNNASWFGQEVAERVGDKRIPVQ